MHQRQVQQQQMMQQAVASGQMPMPVPNVRGEDEEDTMKNLRKTFAGIFGDM